MVRRKLTAILCFSLAITLTAHSAFAATGEVITIPARNVKRPGPIKLTYDFNWVDGNGYRPVRVTAATANGQAVIGAQNVQISVYPAASHATNELFGVTGEVTIPDGAKSATGWLYIPQSKPWLHSVRVHGRVNGSASKALSAQLNGDSDYAWSEAQPSFLFIDSAAPSPDRRESSVAVWKTGNRSAEKTYKLPDVSRLGDIFINASLPTSAVGKDDSQILAFVEDNDRVELRAPNDLPDEWMGYSCLSVVFISLGDAQKIAKTKQWTAIKEWTAAGGILCVFDLGDDFEDLTEVEKLLEMQSLKSGAEKKFRGWSSPQSPATKIRGPTVNSYYQRDYGPDAVDAETIEATPPKVVKPTPIDPSQVEYISRDYQLGKVLAIRSGKPMELDGAYLGGLMNEASYGRLMWRNRNGMSLSNENNDFWDFLLPGVGGAPVISFLVLITFFVAIIGPVNYLVLREFKRLYLILITVPLGAAVVTLSLFFFALITDGIQTRVRVRSFTDIDQQAAHAASMSRQTYYAGIAPGAGLTFPRRATVFPIEHQPQGYINDTKPRQIAFTEDSQQFQTGFISSRNWSQLIIAQSQPSKRGIEFLPKAAGGPSLKNNLEANIQLLILADDNGQFWVARDTRNGDTAAMSPAKVLDVSREFTALIKDNAPAAPKNFDPSQASSTSNAWGWYNNEIDGEFGPPKMSTSLLEQGIKELRTLSPNNLKPRTYYAVVDHSAEVSVGVGWPSLEAGFEIIRGSW